MIKVIDLEEFRTKGSKVFTGRDRGIRVRTDSRIDEFADEFDQIAIVIPEDIMSINPSFLEEFLSNVVRRNGREEFFRKFAFKSTSVRYDISRDLDEAVERILRTESALSKR